MSVLIDVQGTADLTKVMVNGKLQKLAPGKADFARPCKKGGWASFTSPTFKNEGQCVKYLVHGRNAAKKRRSRNADIHFVTAGAPKHGAPAV